MARTDATTPSIQVLERAFTLLDARVRVEFRAADGEDVAAADYIVPPRTSIDVPVPWRPPQAGALSVHIDANPVETHRSSRYVQELVGLVQLDLPRYMQSLADAADAFLARTRPSTP